MTPTPGETTSPTTGNVVIRKPDQALLRRAAPLNLTSELPRSIKRACATAAAKRRVVVYCPPLVPTGRALVIGVNGITRSRDFRSGFVANFASHSASSSRSDPGHWSIAQGDPQALRVLLHPSGSDPRQAATRQQALRLGRTSATLWIMPPFRNFHSIYGGHAVITWRCTGRGYHVSMHGHSNTQRAILLATALADEQPAPCRR